MAKQETKGFETNGPEYKQTEDMNALLKQITSNFAESRPSAGLLARLAGNKLTLTYISYEMGLDDHMRKAEAERAGREFLDDAVKQIKKDYKSASKKALTMKELKDERGESIEKVSLNLRFYYRCWRIYEIS